MSYAALKAVHVASAVVSITGFAARGMLMLNDSPLLKTRFVRVAPHIVDTVLLASAVWLAWLTAQYPFAQAWLTAKVVGLAAYIALGTVALSPKRTKLTKTVAFVLALVLALYIVSVALLRDPAGALMLLH